MNGANIENRATIATLVIVPAWNEGASVARIVCDIRSSSPHVDVIVVDDGSSDETAAAAHSAGALVLRLPFHMGVGGAMRTGYHYALRHGYERAIQVDADGQHEPSDIEAVLKGLDHADISIGSRFAGGGSYPVGRVRRWAMRVLAATISGVANTRLTDVTSGFRAANRRAIRQYARFYPSEYLGDTVDSLVGAIHSGLTVTEVPVKMHPRKEGAPSNGSIGGTLYLMRTTFALMLALVGRRAIRRAGTRALP